jgi:hypothetical protein
MKTLKFLYLSSMKFLHNGYLHITNIIGSFSRTIISRLLCSIASDVRCSKNFIGVDATTTERRDNSFKPTLYGHLKHLFSPHSSREVKEFFASLAFSLFALLFSLVAFFLA